MKTEGDARWIIGYLVIGFTYGVYTIFKSYIKDEGFLSEDIPLYLITMFFSVFIWPLVISLGDGGGQIP